MVVLERAQTMANEDLEIIMKNDLLSQLYSEILDNVIGDMIWEMAEQRVDPSRVTEVRRELPKAKQSTPVQPTPPRSSVK